jgi:exopolysaccharide biosynthesis WecB/TagA/CpsF family protein
VFLLGARPGVAATARAELTGAIPGLRVVGARHGYHHRAERDAAAVEFSGAEVVLVGMGNPQQELWLNEWFCQLPAARIGVGVGAYLDFQARAVRRAPAWMNDYGLEWAYRLAQEPRRLAARYLLEGPQFLLRALTDATRGREERLT